MIRALIFVAGMVLLQSCSNLPAAPPDQYFRLTTPTATDGGSAARGRMPEPPSAATTATGAVRIQIENVEAYGVYAERPLLFRSGGKSAATQQYRYALWAEPPAKMLRNTLVDHLRSQYGADRVWTSEARAPADFVLRGRLRAMEQLLDGVSARALLSLEFVVSDAEGNVAAVFEYGEEIPAASTSVSDYVAALNQGLTQAYAGLDRRLAPVVAGKK